MRILHVVPTRDSFYGGPLRVADSVTEFLRRKGHEARVLPSVHAKWPLFWPGWAGFDELKQGVRWADVVHIHGLWTLPTSFSAAFARRLARPYIVTPHGMLKRWSLRRGRTRKRIYAAIWERKNLDAAAGLHFLTREEYDEARDFGVNAQMFVLPNGVDMAEFRDLPSRDVLETRYPHLRGKVVALFMGRIHLQKGLDVLIPALEKARNKVPSLHLIVAGPDERSYRAVIEQSVREAKLTSAVDFVGGVFGQDKRLVLGGADFFVLTSHHEGDSIAVKEAMAAGLPVLVSRACCFPEISDQGTGIVVAQDVDEIAEGLIRLGESTELRRRMGIKARLFINNCYRWEDIVDRLIGTYQDILTGKRCSDCWL